jgi:hypothetical protein
VKRSILVCIVQLLCFSTVFAQKPAEQMSEAEMQKANDPLADLNAFNLQDSYAPSLLGVPDGTLNTFYLRGVLVKGRQLIRATVPFTTISGLYGEPVSGMGDINIFDSIVLTGDGAVTKLALGPLLVLDTAQRDELGSGKWQAGAAFVAMHPLSGGNSLGALATYQTDFAGDDDRADVSVLTFQPFVTLNIGGGYYARSSGAVWVFDLENDRYLIPVGVGMGRVFRASGAMVNLFVEPQFTVYAEGDGQPGFQIFSGLNFQWAHN